MYGVAQIRTRLLGRRTLNPQAAKQVLNECAIPTSRQNLLQIQYLNPLPVARASAVQRSRLQLSGWCFSSEDLRGDDSWRRFCELGMLLLKLWNEGEVSIPPLHVGLNAFSIQLSSVDYFEVLHSFEGIL